MPAESLAALERRFYAIATRGASDVHEVNHGDGKEAVNEIDDDFVGTSSLPAPARMQVYGNMYWIRLLDTLAEQFPDLYAAVGRAAFAELARDYLRAHPPTSPSLRELGCRLPAFLASRAETPELAEIAELEWTRIDLFDGPDAVALRADDVQRLDPSALAELPLALSATARVLARAGGTVLVHRADGHVHDRVLDEDEAAALAEVAGGTTVGALCERVGDAATAFAYLTRWLEGEILRALA